MPFVRSGPHTKWTEGFGKYNIEFVGMILKYFCTQCRSSCPELCLVSTAVFVALKQFSQQAVLIEVALSDI